MPIETGNLPQPEAAALVPALGGRLHLNYAPKLARTGWYHSFETPAWSVAGVQPVEHLRERYSRFGFEPDLHGKRVIDIGAWDGWFSFECERRGAEVVAVDCVEVENFRQAHFRLGSAVRYVVSDLYDLPDRHLAPADYVLFLGVLYHVRHPLLAIKIVAELTLRTAIIESYVVDGESYEQHRDRIPHLEYYERDDLGGHTDNWFGPSVGALLALCRSAGFARVELLQVRDNRAAVACHRQWARPHDAGDVLILHRVSHAQNYGLHFSTRRDDYVTAWFAVEDGGEIALDEVQPEVEGWGSQPVYLGRWENGLYFVNFLLPPGLAPGWREVRVGRAAGGRSNGLPIAVDLPAVPEGELRIAGVCDGHTWSKSESRAGGALSLWVEGLPGTADPVTVECWVGAVRTQVLFLGEPDGEGLRQINAALPAWLPAGRFGVRVAMGGTESPAVAFEFTAAPGSGTE